MSANGTDGGLEILPIAGRIGAEIKGVRLSGDLRPETVESIRQTLFKYKVIFFRGQEHLDEASHEAFGRLFGDIVPHPTVPSVKGTEAVLDIDGTHGNRATAWHTAPGKLSSRPRGTLGSTRRTHARKDSAGAARVTCSRARCPRAMAPRRS